MSISEWTFRCPGSFDPPASPGALRVSSMPAQGLSHCELVRTSAMYSPARRSLPLPHSTGPSPSGRSFGSDRRHCSSGSDPGPFALTPFLSTSPRSDSWHRFGRTFACAYIRPYHRGLQAGLCVACFSPFRLRVSHDSSHTFPMDDTRPPWVTDALPHRVARTHLGATGWNPCAFAPRLRARPFPVFGRPVHRSGSLPLITTRWFSSSLSDPASRRAPCPPEHRRWWLQVGLSSRSAYPCLGFRRRASLASPYLPSTLAGEALPPPSDIGPGPRTEWDFNPPDTPAARHTTRSYRTSFIYDTCGSFSCLQAGPAPLADTRMRSPWSAAAVWLRRASVKEEAPLTMPRAASERGILPQLSSFRPSSL